jgi:peptidoglycan hydrolase-like protein with peptidoglycan-binding domain
MANALWLADVLRAAGLKVAEVDGWKTRGHASMGDIKGAICHHTAGPLIGNMPSLDTVVRGRVDLAGPLCNLALGRDGTWYIVAAGLAYHAGRGIWGGVTAGNSQMIGIEAENTGLANDPWPEVQVEAYARGIAAVLTHIGAEPIMCCGHKEYALPKGRKIDPTFDMIKFRARVAALMNGAAPRPPIPAQDAKKRPTLRRGAVGEDVAVLQRAIGVTVDRKFGSTTEAALRTYQRLHHLVADGIAGPATWSAIDVAKVAA